jgi:hypothetical protein
MNIRADLYLSGGGLVVRRVYGRRGHSAVVLDPARRAKEAAQAMVAGGMTARAAAHALGRTEAFVVHATRRRSLLDSLQLSACKSWK